MRTMTDVRRERLLREVAKRDDDPEVMRTTMAMANATAIDSRTALKILRGMEAEGLCLGTDLPINGRRTIVWRQIRKLKA